MKRFLGLVGLIWGLSNVASAQSTDPWLGLVPVVEHTEGELAGMTTYRLYLYMQNEDDFLVSCSGDDMNPMELASTSTPAWFQHEVATTAFATDVNPVFFPTFPEFAYDSWLTIGAEDNSAAVDVISLVDPNFDAFAAFEDGEGFYVDGQIGSAWFVLPIATNAEAFAGEDLKTLVAQFTTSGAISGQFQVQVFRNFDNNNEFREVLSIVTACNDPAALNYDAASFSDDGCLYPDGGDQVLEATAASLVVEAFPSPASSTFQVRWDGPGQASALRVVAMDGRVVKQLGQVANATAVDVSDLPNGRYLIQAEWDNVDGATKTVQTSVVVLR